MKLEKLQKELKNIDPSIEAAERDGCIVLTGTVDDYMKAYKAGRTAVDKKRYIGVINDIKTQGVEEKEILPTINDKEYDGYAPDVLIIGGGISGCATARELTRLNLKVMVVEKGADVASGQTSRNGGVAHVGLNFSSDTLKLKYCVAGNDMLDRLSKELDFPFEHKGQVTFVNHKWELLALKIFSMGGPKKGIYGSKIMSPEELRKIEPCVPEWSAGGLYMPTGGILCPYKMTIAFAENAVTNGALVALNTAVLGMKVENGLVKEVKTNRGVIYPKVVVNAAGIYADKIAEMAADRTFTIHPRKGTDLISDKKVGYMATTSMGKSPVTLSPKQLENIPANPVDRIKALIANLHSHSKGIGVIHSVDGNMLVGPNADETPYREDYTTDAETVNHIIKVQQEVIPNFGHGDVITYFTGVRASTYEEDFVVRQGIRTKNIFEEAGIQSPGLASAPAIAVDVAKWIEEYLKSTGMEVTKNENFNPSRKGIVEVNKLSPEARDKLIKENPDYGLIVCRCEEISKGEILDSLRSPLPVYTVDGVKKRVRPGMGRCQGSFCMPLVMKIIAEEKGCELTEVKKARDPSWIIDSPTK